MSFRPTAQTALLLGTLLLTVLAFAATRAIRSDDDIVNTVSLTERVEEAGQSAELEFTTTIADPRVDVLVTDIDGVQVRALQLGQPLDAGEHSFEWDITADDGSRVEPGLYKLRVILAEEGRDILPPGTVAVDGVLRPDEPPPAAEVASDRDPLLWLGIVLAAALAAAALALPLDGPVRLRLLAVALVLAPLLILADNWNADRIVDLRESRLKLMVGGAGGLIMVGAFAAMLVRRPGWLPLIVVAVLPFRIPVDLAGSSSNLLLPLYGLLAAAVLAALIRPRQFLPRELPREGPGRMIGIAIGAYLVFYALQTGYADDPSKAAENVCFFFVPFAVVFLLLAAADWTPALMRRAMQVVVAEFALIVAIGLAQYVSLDLFWNDKVIAGNEAHSWTRVNSLFYDPNIMARYLGIAMIALAAVIAWGRGNRSIFASAGFGVLLVGVAITFSQTGLIALLAGLLTLAIVRWGLIRATIAGAGVVVLLGLSAAAIGGGGVSEEDTTGRSGLVSGGLELAEQKPIIGNGSGSFPDEFAARFGSGDGAAVVSHTEPITVAAEQGAIGMLPYLFLVGVAGLAVWKASGAGLGPSRRGDPFSAFLLAAFAAMLVNSLGYAAFMTDPITWVILALATTAPALGASSTSAGGGAGTSAERTAPARAA